MGKGSIISWGSLPERSARVAQVRTQIEKWSPRLCGDYQGLNDLAIERKERRWGLLTCECSLKRRASKLFLSPCIGIIHCSFSCYSRLPDPVTAYIAILLGDGRCLEAYQVGSRTEPFGILDSGNMVAVVREVKILAPQNQSWLKRLLTNPRKWEIIVGPEMFGTVQLTEPVSAKSVYSMECSNGQQLPIRVSYWSAPSSPQSCWLSSVAEAICSWKNPIREYTDAVISVDDVTAMNREQLAAYFMAAVLFRTYYYNFDFS